MFKITRGKGFHITLKNGVTLSTQFGKYNYCNNMDIENIDYKHGQCENAEIAIWKGGKWITQEILKKLNLVDVGEVYGYVDTELWLKILNECNNYKEGK